MREKSVALVLCAIALACAGSGDFWLARTAQEASTIIVPDDYPTIQEAINNANEGGTIFIKAGIYYEHIVVNNTVSLVGEDSSTTIIDGNGTGIVVHIVRDAVNVTGLSIRESGSWPDACIGIDNVKDCVISANIVYNNNKTSVAFVGIFLQSSEGNSVIGNDVRNNPIGINVRQSSSNTIVKNRVAHAHLGIQVCNSSNSNLVSENSLTDCEIGVAVNQGSHYNGVFRNQIECSNEAGIGIGVSSNNNLVVANAVADSYYGIRILSSSDNTLYHNRIIDNDIQAYVTGGFTNEWDNGYPTGGNCWSDYVGVDVRNGPNQDVHGSDGIGDAPHIIDSNNRDLYPLMKPYPWDPHDLGITSVAVSRSVVGQGYAVRLNVTVFNYGNNAEHFNATVYANTTIVYTAENLMLASRNSTTVTFAWNTTGWANGNYTLGAVADAVLDETDTADNTLDSWAFVTLAGDVDGNRQVSFFDLVTIAEVYGVSLPDPRYVPNCDVDDDGDIDIFDIVLAAGNYGKSW